MDNTDNCGRTLKIRFGGSKLSGIITRFASGLGKDLSAVENAVVSPSSEVTNSKLKMTQRTMYGRCGKELLTAKLILSNG